MDGAPVILSKGYESHVTKKCDAKKKKGYVFKESPIGSQSEVGTNRAGKDWTGNCRSDR